MNIDSIQNGVVIDHISAGKGMELYALLNLDALNCPIVIGKNLPSRKLGTKDIIKIDADIELNTDILGYIDPDVTINVIKDGKIAEKKTVSLPERLVNVISCKNPRCITSCEQELDQVFTLTDKDNRVYRCLYCETKAKEENH